MGSTTFKVLFEGDASGIKKASQDAGDAAGGLSSKLSAVGTAAAGFVIGGGLLKAPGFLIDAAKAAAEDEQSTAKLQATIRSLGGDYDAHVASVNAAISANQKLGFSDDDTRDSFDMLAQATGSTEEALKRQQVAMDLARGAGIPLSEASKLLGKVTDDNLQVFKRMGITLPDVANEADVLAAVQQKFAGQSDAYAKSTSGQFAILQDRLGEAKETIGYALLPVMAGLADVLATKVVPAVEALAAGFQEHVMPAIETIGGFIRDNVLPPLQQLAEWFTGNEDAMKAAAVAIGTVLVIAFTAWAVSAGAAAVATIAAAAPVIALVAGIALLAAGVYLLITHWDDITAKFPALGTAADGVKTALTTFATFFTDTLIPAVQAVVTFVTDHWHEVWDAIQPVLDTITLALGTFWQLIQTDFNAAIGILEGIIDVFVGVFTGDWGRARDGVMEIVNALWGLVEGTFNTFLDFVTGLSGIWSDKGKELLGFLWNGIKNAAVDLGNWFVDLPSKLLGYLGDIGSLLYDAGVQLIQGFISGIASMFGAVKDKLGDLTGSLTSWKGPPERDVKLLWESGRLVIKGFMDGIDASTPELKAKLEAITNQVKLTMQAATAAAARTAAMVATGIDPVTGVSSFGGNFGAKDPGQNLSASGPNAIFTWGNPDTPLAPGGSAYGFDASSARRSMKNSAPTITIQQTFTGPVHATNESQARQAGQWAAYGAVAGLRAKGLA